MILLDKLPLNHEDLNDQKAKHHVFAKEYNDTIAYLHDTYKNGYIRFKRQNAVKYTKGADDRGNEIPKMAEPVKPWRIPLQAYAVTGNKGKHLWACCMGAPEPKENGLWDMGTIKSMSVKEDILVNINENPDLAFFLYKISPFVRRRLITVVDPKLDDETLGTAERELTERKYAVWNMLADEAKLKTMARAYGMNAVDSKQPNAIRKDLEKLLETNDKLKRQNPAVKGTKEFIEEMKVTDGLLLRNFMQKAIDDKKLTWKGDGRWKIGEKIVCQVPSQETLRRNDYLCNWLMAGNNTDKLKEFIVDLVDKDYLDTIPDTKDGRKEWEWFAKVSGENPAFKKTGEIKDFVYKTFCPLV